MISLIIISFPVRRGIHTKRDTRERREPRPPIHPSNFHAMVMLDATSSMSSEPEAEEVVAVVRARLFALSSWYAQLRACLDRVARVGDFAMTTSLLQTGAAAGFDCLDDTRDGRNLFASAAYGGNPNIVRALLQAGGSAGDENGIGNINKLDPVTGQYPIHIATCRGHRAVVRALLRYGAEVDAAVDPGAESVIPLSCDSSPRELLGGMTALHWAALRGHWEIVDDLIVSGANMDARVAHSGESALHLAARCGHQAAVRVLLDAGAVPTLLSRSNLTAFDLAASHNHADTVREFLCRGIDPNMKNPLGYTALHQAAYHSAGAVLRLLVEAGGSVSSVTDMGFTPLHVAAFSPHSSSSTDSEEDGEKKCGNGCSAVQAVARCGGDVQVDALDASGSTPLRTACVHLREQSVRDLLQMGANEKLFSLSSDSFSASESVVDSAATPTTAASTTPPTTSRSERIGRVMTMLAAAPANRAWRCRGWLVLLRARALASSRNALGDDSERSYTSPCREGPCRRVAHRDGGSSREHRPSGRQRISSDSGYDAASFRPACWCECCCGGGCSPVQPGGAGTAVTSEREGALRAVVAKTVGVEEDAVFRRVALFL